MKITFSFFVLVVAIALAAMVADAEERMKTHSLPDGAVKYAILTQDSDVQRLLITLERPQRLPALMMNRVYDSKDKAESDYARLTAGWEEYKTSEKNQKSISEVPGAQLWSVSESWSEEWETKYSNWIQQNLTSDYFSNDLRTDCADVLYSMRWIFARENRLPAVNRLGGSGVIFTHASMREDWKDLPTDPDWRKDRRFLAALNYMLELTYTYSLIGDSYPIQISSHWLRPGTHLSYPRGESGHNYTVTEVKNGKDGELPIALISSTVPRDFHRLVKAEFNDPQQPTAGGFQNMRWPTLKSDGRWTLVPAEQMPGYSLEQYSPEFVATEPFDEAIFNRVAPERVVDKNRKTHSLLKTLTARYQERIPIVSTGFKLCFPDRCPEGSVEYEGYSTPSRDQRIADIIQLTKSYVAANPETQPTYDSFLRSIIIDLEGDNFRQHNKRLKELIQVWDDKEFSSDPNHSRNRRWGIR